MEGGTAEDLLINPMGREGGQETEFRARIELADSSVATVHRGRATPRRAGETYVDAVVGDCLLRFPIVVIGRAASLPEIRPFQVYAANVALSGRDSASWPIPAGRYQFYPTGPGGRLNGTGLNCAVIANGFSCLAPEGASLTLSRATRGAGVDAVRLEVRRAGDSPSGLSARTRHTSGRSRANASCMNVIIATR